MKRRTACMLGGFVAALAVLIIGGAFLLMHDRGADLVLRIAQRVTPGELRWGAVSGNLYGPLQIDDLEYRHAGSAYRAGRLVLDWEPLRLLTGRLVVRSLRLHHVGIVVDDTADAPSEPFDPAGRLLLPIELRDARAENIRIRRGDREVLVIEQLRIVAAADADRVDVQTLMLRAPQIVVDAHGRFGFDSAQRTDLAVDWRVAVPPYAPVAGSGRITGTPEQLRLEQRIETPQTADVRLDIEQPFTAPRWRARIDAPSIALTAIDPDWPDQRFGGRLLAEGTRDRYRLQLDAQMEGADLPRADVQATAQGDRARIDIDRVSIRILDGTLTGTAALDWSAGLQWEARLQAANINPGGHWSEWPGRLDARLRADGHASRRGMALNARLEALDGELRGYPVRGAGTIAHDADGTRVDALQLRSGSAELAVNGRVGAVWDVRWRLDAPAVEQLIAGYTGALSAQGTLSGARLESRLHAQLRARNLAGPGAAVSALHADVDVGIAPRAAMKLNMRGTDLRLAERHFDNLEVALTGALERHVLTLHLRGPEDGLQVSARGGWNGARWSGRVERADWRIAETGAWQLTDPVMLQLGRAQGAVDESCWRQLQSRLCAQFEYDEQGRRLSARLRNGFVSRLGALPQGVRIEGGALAGEFDLRMPARAATQARASARLEPGTVSWPQGSARRRQVFGGGNAQLQFDAEGARADAQLRLSGSDYLDLQITAPGYTLGTPTARQPMSGRLQGEVRDLSLIDGLSERIDDVSGVVRINAAIDGTPAEPRLRGVAQLIDGRAFIVPAGVQIEDGQLILSDSADAVLRLRGSARSGPGRVTFNGVLGATPQAAGGTLQSADIRITGTDFEAVDLPEARVLASPDLRVVVQGRRVNIDGAVHIPQARIEPRDTRGAVMPSPDVVRVDVRATEPRTPWTVHSRVHLSLGNDVMFKGFGVQGRLAGALGIVDDGDQGDDGGKQTRVRGELAIHDGTYNAYGQELQIERGRALYRDSPPDNPGLDVRATRKSGDVLAGVRVLGTAQDPVAELYSQPPLPQADVLSYLLLGRPVSQAGGGEGELLFKAATSLGLKGGTRLAQSIGSRFGLDDVSVTGGELEGAALTLGKYLSPRLYLNYSIGLLDAADRLRLRYQITEHISVQTETGAQSGGDVLYTIER